jgi:hypothetical protein
LQQTDVQVVKIDVRVRDRESSPCLAVEVLIHHEAELGSQAQQRERLILSSVRSASNAMSGLALRCGWFARLHDVVAVELYAAAAYLGIAGRETQLGGEGATERCYKKNVIARGQHVMSVAPRDAGSTK